MDTWEANITQFWEQVEAMGPEMALQMMTQLVEQKPPGNPEALYEMASIQDFLGHESAAIPLYRDALAAGLAGERRPQAIVQLASSLRNVGASADAVELLVEAELDAQTQPGARAFLALALHDCGRSDEALQVALLALAETLPLYGHSVSSYAKELTEPEV